MSCLVRATSLTHYREVARASGLDPVRMLLDAGLSPRVLDAPDLMIPVDRLAALLQASAERSGNEGFGLCMAEGRQLSNLGAVGLLVREQPTLRDSLAVLMRYLPLLNGALSLMVEDFDSVVLIREEVKPGKANRATRQRIELALGVMLRLMRQFLGADWQPRRVCLAHPAPRDLRTHHRVMGPTVAFDQDVHGIVCAREDLDTPNPAADPAMARYARQLLDAAVQPPGDALPDDVRRTVLLLLPTGRCSMARVSAHVGVECRTIQRRLADDGQSFSAIVNDVRKELAVRHVLESDRPLAEVAGLLGFCAPSGLSRWFHAQYGCSAKDSRARRPPSPSRD